MSIIEGIINYLFSLYYSLSNNSDYLKCFVIFIVALKIFSYI